MERLISGTGSSTLDDARSVAGTAPLAGFTSCGHFAGDVGTGAGEGVAVLLAFDCVARMDIMGDVYPQEFTRIAEPAHRAKCFGTYTDGEFGRSKGVGGVHNATPTALAL